MNSKWYQVSKFNKLIRFDGRRLWIRNGIKWANLINSSDLMGSTVNSKWDHHNKVVNRNYIGIGDIDSSLVSCLDWNQSTIACFAGDAPSIVTSLSKAGNISLTGTQCRDLCLSSVSWMPIYPPSPETFSYTILAGNWVIFDPRQLLLIISKYTRFSVEIFRENGHKYTAHDN